MRKRSIKSTLQAIAGAATLHAAPVSFAAVAASIAVAAPAEARVVPSPLGHQIRYVRLPGKAPNTYRSGLWVINRATGRIRLCVIDETAQEQSAFLKCSPWAGGAGAAGRFQVADIRQYIQALTGRRVWAIVGVWILNYQSGQVSACLIRDHTKPVDSLRCSAFK